MRDPYLKALVDEVERTGDAVSVSFVLHSGAIVTGFLRQSQHFAAITRRETNASRQTMDFRRVGQQAIDALNRAEKAQVVLDAVPPDDARDTNPDHITLSDVTMIWNNGSGLRLLTMRIRVDAVAGWWIKSGTPLAPRPSAA